MILCCPACHLQVCKIQRSASAFDPAVAASSQREAPVFSYDEICRVRHLLSEPARRYFWATYVRKNQPKVTAVDEAAQAQRPVPLKGVGVMDVTVLSVRCHPVRVLSMTNKTHPGCPPIYLPANALPAVSELCGKRPCLVKEHNLLRD